MISGSLLIGVQSLDVQKEFGFFFLFGYHTIGNR